MSSKTLKSFTVTQHIDSCEWFDVPPICTIVNVADVTDFYARLKVALSDYLSRNIDTIEIEVKDPLVLDDALFSDEFSCMQFNVNFPSPRFGVDLMVVTVTITYLY